MPSGKLRGHVESTVRRTYGNSAAVSNYKSKVVHPRNPKLVKTQVEDDKQSPSAYMAEMQLTTEERLKMTYEMRVPQIIELLDMSEQTLQKFTSMNIEEPIFQPFPSDIVFQNFEPFQKYEVPLQLRNNDKIARLVKVTQTDSPYFKIISPLDVGHKVAPGMDTIFIIQFTPDEKKDYSHELICITEREKFLVPVKAIGARAILDFPDEINFGSAPVKNTTTKTLLVRNIGNKEARFHLSVEKPFSASPDSGRLSIGESLQVHVEFNALQTGDHCSNMNVHYDTGEDIYIGLYGAAVDCNIRLDKSTLKMENTFITSASQRTVTIANRSDILVHFKWTKFATLREELQQKDRFYFDLKRQEETERDAFIDECLSDVSVRNQMSIVSRKYKNKVKMVNDDDLLFEDDIVSVEPVEGDIWPNSQAETAIIFKPQEAQSYARTLYCDVYGRESRLPLRVRGEGIGPLVEFSFDKLDVGNVFVNSEHSYEIILSNKGDIDAVYKLCLSDSLFGLQFKFIPAQGIVVPGSYQAIKICFCSPVLGNFDEEFTFSIEGSTVKPKLCISGSVIGPTFHFDVPKLKFGTVSYGFVNTRHFKLKNTSLIPMKFHLHVPAEGGARKDSNTCSESLLDSNITDSISSVMLLPREFDIVPSSGTIQPQNEMDIRIDFVSTTVKHYDVSLVVDIEGVGEEVMLLPIIAKCVVPVITIHTPILNYGRCFIHHPYELPIQLANDSDLPAKYELLAQIADDQTPILYSSTEPKGVIQARSVKDVPVQITAEFLEELQTIAYLMIFGSSDQPMPVQIHCVGEGPVVHVTPTHIDYGTISVLSEITRTVKLSNESLIPAQFSCEMVRPQSLFSVEPCQGIIAPEDVVELKVTAVVDDTVKFQDKLSINVNDSKVQTVSLIAYGCGTTIVSEPPMATTVNLGAQFSCQPCTRVFCLTNKGRRPQQIYWTTEGFHPFKTKKRSDYNPEDMKYQGVPPPPDPPKPVFSLTPDRMVLHPGQSQEVTLKGYYDQAETVKERMICHAIIGSSTGKDKIIKVDIVADFINPLLEFSQREVNFCVMKYPKSTLELEIKQVVMKNVSSLPLRVKLKVFVPFQLLIEDKRWAPLNVQSSETDLCLAISESVPVLIQFNPAYKDDSVTRIAESFLEVTFKDHPQMDFVKLKGEVFFPNLTFETTDVDFGCILNDTEVTKVVSVTNHSPIDVKYQWCFIDSIISIDDKEEDEGIGDIGYGSQDEKFDLERRERESSDGSSRQSLPHSRPLSAQGEIVQPGPWLPTNAPPLFDIGIDEVFDILPLYSTLHPMETQKLQFTFYGHANVSGEAIARCSIYGGPDYDIHLKGSASLVQYFFDKKTIGYGKQLFDQIAIDEVILHNTGKVSFDFVVLNMNTDEKIQPGLPNVTPSKGHISAFSKQTITINYLPGVPKVFEKSFQIRIAHFEPDEITLMGEGVFPRVMFDLPLDKSDERYASLVEQAKENLENQNCLSTQGRINDDLPVKVAANAVGDLRLHMEVERLIVEHHSIEQQMTPRLSSLLQATKPVGKPKKTKAKPINYLLDFGFVVFGTVRSHIIRVTNNGYFPVSFAPEKMHLHGTGFDIELDKIRNLPGSPDNESVEFMVTFDPKGGNISLGAVDTLIPITTLGGPLFGLRLKAIVTMPEMKVSTDRLEFGNVICGQCKVMTIQLHNYQPVRCDWSSEPPEEKKKSDKMVPLHLRKKLRSDQPKPKHFEVMPPVGTLQPGQRINVQVKFMPTEEIIYNQRVVIRIAQSTSRVVVNVTGHGSEPKVEFSSTLVEFGPVLPHSNGDEKELILKNPCSFPIELYSLEFDKQYLEEEKMLRNVKGYDEYNTILLPPRQPGEKLPKEVTESYLEQQTKKEDELKAQADTAARVQAEREAEDANEGTAPDIATVPPTPGLPGSGSDEGAADGVSSVGMGELEITPVSAAIARYLGIDLSSEGKAARNRRGIAVVVYGAPLSGKTSTSVALAKKYGAACLTVDGIVNEALSTGSSSAARRARELCAAAARVAKEAEQASDPHQPSQPGSLSIEAVAQLGSQNIQPHNTTGSITGAQSFMAREARKTSTVGGSKGFAGKNVPQVQQNTPPETPPIAGPIGRKLSVSASVCGEDGLYSCILPEDLLVELLAERMLLSDCQQGIVIDGLDSIFAPSLVATATAILRALNNRKYIYFVTLLLNHARLKVVEEKKKEEEAKLEKLKEEEEKHRLEEMSEDEYDTLTDEEKAEVDRKHLEQKKERLKREMEKQDRERRERELQVMLEEKKLEEEKNTKRKRAGQQGGTGAGKKGHDAKEKKPEKSNEKLTPGRVTAVVSQAQNLEARGGAPSVVSERSDSSDVIDDKKRLSVVKGSKHPRQSSAALPGLQIDEPKVATEEEEKERELTKKFSRFECSLRDIDSVLQYWDRSTGTINRPDTPKSDIQEPDPLSVPGFVKKGRGDKRDKEREKEKNKEVSVSPLSGGSGDHDDEEDSKKDGLGVPNIMIDVMEPQQQMADKVLEKNLLPTYEEVLDGLGLGPHGPPIPPPANFAVVPYPVRRRPPLGSDPPSHYVFVASGPDDPNAPQEDKAKEPEPEMEKASERAQEHSRKGGRVARDKEDRESGGAKSRRERQNSARKGKSVHGTSSPPPSITPATDEDKGDGIVGQIAPQLAMHRWIMQANQSVTLRIRFRSQELGQFDQTLNIEIVGTRRRYQLFCRGVCAFPAISREPRVVFSHRKKYRKPEEVVHKKYILSSETFEFGPLLCGKTRDRYKEDRYPENAEKLTILNTSPLESEISFCFQQDSTAVTFLLDPPITNLKPGQSQALSIWAYPKTPGFFEDALVCCIRENPEPVVFKVSCHGVRPELELDRKQLQFDRVLLHRKDTRTIFLRNSTLLPVAWRINGLDNLGDDFSLTTEHGIIEAKSEYALQMHFRAVRPTNVKKIIRLEVSDVEQIMGLVQAENIQVHAEAYDVALDMSFPKGTDGGLDFGILKVMDETKQACSLKNKGRFEINYNFVFEPTESYPANVHDLFTVIPNRGPLLPTDRPTQVQVIFRSKKEVTIKDQAILKCQIIEPHLGEAGEVIASIPVKISVRSVYSKYSISPISDINFGAMLVNTKKVLVFAIENKGEFDFRYSILKMINTASQGRQKLGPLGKRTKSRDGSSSGRSLQENKPPKPKRADSVKGAEISTGAPNIRLQLGMFTLYPAIGSVPAGSSVQITVDMTAESPGFFEEDIAIDISDRPPTDHPQGIPYKLIGEACVPGITAITPSNIGSIFEEHLIVKQLNLFQYLTHDLSSGAGVYGEDENKFIFYNTIVGRKAKARFKISNTNKVPCDLVLSVKPISSKPSARWHDVYEVEPQRASISPHDFIYATVTFTPPSMQSYSAIFEAAVDGMPSVVSKYRNLTFDIQGEGNLPRISIKRPTSRNKKGNTVLLFRRRLLHRTQVMSLVLHNEGALVSQVFLSLKDSNGVYKISYADNTKALVPQDWAEADDTGNRLSVLVPMGEMAEFRIEFTPSSTGRLVGELKISVIDNPYEEGLIQLIGEGYEDDVTIDNIRSSGTVENQPDFIEIAENVSALRENHIRFNDCAVGVAKQLSFTLTNHSNVDTVRFNWNPPQEIIFSPCTGHLNPGCAKDITITFLSSKPKVVKTQNIPCKVTKMKIGEHLDKPLEWDDRMRVVKWVDVSAEMFKPEDSSAPPGSGGAKSNKPGKKRVIEVEPEPPFTALDDGHDLELLVSGVCDYSKMRCKVDNVHFKDTLMFQTRIFSFTASNKGDIQFDYQWTFENVGHTNTVSLDEGAVPSDGHSTSQQTPRPSTIVTGCSSVDPNRGQASSRPKSSMAGDRPSSALALAYETGSVVSEASADTFPFTIEPESGSIPAGNKANFVLKFAPMDVVDYHGLLACRISNPPPGKESLSIPVCGRGLLPYAHFELEDSDYITGGQRNPELRGAGGAPPGSTLDPNTKVIEFTSCGIKVKNQKHFQVLNPTSTSYSFTWTNEDTVDGNPPDHCNFHCLTPHGTIHSGKKAEIVFEYVSESLDLVESFWRFFVPEFNISVPFVLVGHTFEPALSFDRSHINFREILVGHPVEQIVYLVNEESVPFSFSFKEESLHTDGYASSLAVKPVAGSIEPKSRLPIEIAFTASAQKEVNFNVLCTIKKKTSALTLNVKAEGYSLNAQLYCEDSMGNKVALTPKGTNRINLGEVEINEKAIRSLYIFNSGKFNFDFSWELIKKTKLKDEIVSISPISGTVPSNTRKRCQLVFCPLARLSLKSCDLLLRVKNGPSFNINITGSGVQPGLSFSFIRHDFGPCFLYRAGMPLQRTTLLITNQDTKDISIECQHENTAYLEVHSQPGVLQPNKSMEVDMLFYPREPKHYHVVIPFEINGLSTINVEVFGQGTDMKVEVLNPANKKLSLGALRIGQTSQKSIQLINRSPAPITFTVAVTPSTVQLQQDSVISVLPTNEITLRPNGGTGTVEVLFRPKGRIPQFTEEIMLECAGLSQPIFMITGACQGIEVTLDNESLPFGAVMIGSRSSRQLIMPNSGDVGAAFAWNSDKFEPDFSISPSKGYISPAMEVAFQIVFHPITVNHDIRYEGLRCAIEGAKPLKLVLTGSCVPQAPLKEVLHFTTHVRTRETRNLVIHNRTNQLWELRPVIEGEHWSGPDSITVEPQQSKNYELTYKPLIMTVEGKKHTGSVFFPLPDGSGLLYNITGTAEGPKPVSNIQRDVPCKTPYTELLSVSNWLRRPQRFRAVIEVLKPEKPDNATAIKGLDYIDVPGLSKRDYKLNFFAHKEGSFSAKVTFRNDQTNEYLCYYVTFKATAAGVMAAIELCTPVRKSTSHVVTLHNPLNGPVTFNSQCSVADIQLPPNFTIPPLSEGSCMFEYLPLKAGENVAGKLSFQSSELGAYQYDLVLTATSAGPEAPVHFRASLGTSQIQTCRFVSFAKSKVEYSCKVDSSDFHVEKTITAASASSGGTDVGVDVTYEPVRLGDTRATLSVSSSVGGEYIFPLFGHCSPPKPQGPYAIKSGATTSIPFKNVFPSSTQFQFFVDNPCFNVKTSETVRAKKTHNIIVGYEAGQTTSKAPRMAKLMISCPKSAGGAGNVTWTYYLKGNVL